MKKYRKMVKVHSEEEERRGTGKGEGRMEGKDGGGRGAATAKDILLVREPTWRFLGPINT